MAFSFSGKILASGHGVPWRKGFSNHYRPLSIRVWDISTGELTHWHTGSWGTMTNLYINDLAFTPDECHLISIHAYHRKALRKDEGLKPGFMMQDLATGNVLHQSQNNYSFVSGISSDSALVAFGDIQQLCLFSLKDYNQVGTSKQCFIGHFNKDNDLVTTNARGLIEIWKQGNGSGMMFETPKPASMQEISYSPGDGSKAYPLELLVHCVDLWMRFMERSVPAQLNNCTRQCQCKQAPR